MHYKEHINSQQRYDENGGCFTLVATTFVLLLSAFFLVLIFSGCRSTKSTSVKHSEVSVETSTQAQATEQTTTATTTEVQTTSTGEERTTAQTTIRKTTYSAPDSLGRQYIASVEETVTLSETQRTDGVRQENKTKTTVEQSAELQTSSESDLKESSNERTTEKKKSAPWWIYIISVVALVALSFFTLKKFRII